ncbi:MAG: hypothetical protein ACRENG_13190 [bacterium]
MKNCRQRCGPLHAPSGHNFSKPLRSRCPRHCQSPDGVPALRETARAIIDTAKWWP